MGRFIPLLGMLIVLLACAGPVSGEGVATEEESIKKTIEECYVRGIHIDRDIPAIRKGFHPEFNMLIYRDGTISKLPIEDWISAIEEGKKKNPDKPGHKTTCEFPMVDVTGNAAVAKVEIYRDGKHIYTDYMSLYKFEDGWKIVNKIYFSHK